MDLVQIDRSALPLEEHETAQFIEDNLAALQRGAESFHRTVGLYMHIRELNRLGTLDTWNKVGWTRICGRNGAIEAYSFQMVMEYISDSKHTAPTLWEKVALDRKKDATRMFSREFPEISGIRNSTAHPGELSGNPNQIAKHRMKGAASNAGFQIDEGCAPFISDAMHADEDKLLFSASFKGGLASYELSYEKGEALARCARYYCEAFHPLEHPTVTWQREQMRETDMRPPLD